MVDALNRRLLGAHAEGRRIIVLVDEAQNLSAEVLEQVRLLTNLETPTQKLLQIILIGQPELRELLDRTSCASWRSASPARYHLQPLSREETQGYVRHRLKVAGATEEIFSLAALDEVHRLSGGIPRIINVTCDRALLGAYARETRAINAAFMRQRGGRGVRPQVCSRLGALAGSPWRRGRAAVRCRLPAGMLLARQMAALRAARRRPPRAVEGRHPGIAAPVATVPATRVPKPPPSEPLNDLLQANGADTTDAAAFRRLLSLWGTAMADDRDPCGQAAKAGLACLEQKRLVDAGAGLNRPAILTLTDEQRAAPPRCVVGLDERYRDVNLGEHNARVCLDELVARLVRRIHRGVEAQDFAHARLLSLGMQGDEVRWLRRSLNALRGGASDPEHADVYDQELAIAVQNFQREHRLNVDGIAGVQTQVVLDTALGGSRLASVAVRRAARRLGILHVIHSRCTEEI